MVACRDTQAKLRSCSIFTTHKQLPDDVIVSSTKNQTEYVFKFSIPFISMYYCILHIVHSKIALGRASGPLCIANVFNLWPDQVPHIQMEKLAVH